jgi:hypothetical protein
VAGNRSPEADDHHQVDHDHGDDQGCVDQGTAEHRPRVEQAVPAGAEPRDDTQRNSRAILHYRDLISVAARKADGHAC